MTQFSKRGFIVVCVKLITVIHLLHVYLCSYLKALLVPFNEMTNKFLMQLKPLADGVSKVPMKLRLGEFTLSVISKVNSKGVYGTANY